MSNKVNIDMSLNARGFVDGMNQAKDAVADYETEQRRVQDNVGNFRKEFAAAKKEVMNLAQAYRNLSSEEKNSQFGKEMAKQLQAAKEKAAEMTDLMGDMNQELKNMASDTANFDALTQGMGVFMNTTSAALGMIAQFTGNEEDARNAVVAFTTAQSTLNALTQISNALQEQSALMLGVQRIQYLATAAAAKLKTVAEEHGIVVTTAATAAQAAFNTVAKANPYVLLASALIAVIGALSIFTSDTDEATEAEERLQKEIEEAEKKAQRERTTFLGAAASHYSDAESLWGLYRAYKNTNDELEKTAILEDATKMFKSLGIEIKGTADAEKILTEQITTVTQLMKLQGDAAGISALRMERFKESMDAMMKSGFSAHVASSIAGAAVSDLDEELNRINSEINKRKAELKIVDKGLDTSKTNNKTKIDYDKGSLEDLQKKLSEIQDKLKKKNMLKVDVDKAKAEIKKLKQEIEDKQIELGIKEVDPKDIPFTEAWYNEEINKLKDKKAKLPIDAYVEREQLQNQINTMQLKLKLEVDGVEIKGNKALADAWAGNTVKSINGINEAISTLQKQMKDTDWTNIEDGQHTFEEYTQKIQELKAELEPLQKSLENAMLTPLEKAQKQMQQTQQTISSVGNAIQAAGEMFNALGETSNSTELKVTGLIAQAVATVALSYANALNTAKTWVDWLAFGLSGAATMINLISQIKTATAGSYAEGGIIGGHSYTGDKLMAFVNSNEAILNTKQQRKIVDALDYNGVGGYTSKIEIEDMQIRGSDLYIMFKNYEKSHTIGRNKNIR